MRPALLELHRRRAGIARVPAPGSGRLFYMPAFAGGLFGLLGGYLTDLFGRRRVLTCSILIYALRRVRVRLLDLGAVLLVLRCIVVHRGMRRVRRRGRLARGAVPRSEAPGEGARLDAGVRSLGGLLVATANGLCITYARACRPSPASASAIQDPHAPWRYTLMSGVIPAMPLILIRPFLPESPAGSRRRRRHAEASEHRGDLLAGLRRTTSSPRSCSAMAYGAAFGAIQQIPQIVPGLPEVREMVRACRRRRQLATQDGRGQRHQGPGGRRAGRPRRPGRAGGRHRQPPQADPHVPGARADLMPIVFALVATTQPDVAVPGGSSSAGLLTVGAVQLLGQLPAARLPDPPAGHRRELRREHRRPHDRHLVRLGDGELAVMPGGPYRCSWRSCGWSARPSTWSASSPASGSRSPRKKKRPTNLTTWGSATPAWPPGPRHPAPSPSGVAQDDPERSRRFAGAHVRAAVIAQSGIENCESRIRSKTPPDSQLPNYTDSWASICLVQVLGDDGLC